MFIIGYLDQVRDGRIRIPEFHTGHLGFLPDIRVRCLGPVPEANAVNTTKCSPSSTELVITPFALNDFIYRVTCKFRESRGIVNRFVALLAELDINILSLESASVDRAQHHVISATIDLSPSEVFRQLDRYVPEDKMIQFRHLLWSLHADDYIAFNLALKLVRRCSDIISWSKKREPGSEISVPEISIAPLIGSIEGTDLFARSPRDLLIERGPFPEKSSRSATFITLPPDTIDKIRDDIGELRTQPLYYILVSETNSRSLRLKFVSAARVRKLYQVGFRTVDEAGALRAITDALEQAGFNIAISLTRKINQAQSVWEAVLEYEGADIANQKDEADPCGTSLEAQRRFVKAKLENPAIRWQRGAGRYNIHIFTPPHIPDIRGDGNHSTRARLGPGDAEPLGLRERRSTSVVTPIETPHRNMRGTEQRWIIDYTANFPRRDRVFISYSGSADDLKKILHERLERATVPGGTAEWVVEKYEGNSGNPTAVDRIVRHRILTSDIFVGIWRNETGSDTEISPWLPYELGIAKAYQKPCFLITSRKLPAR